MLAYQLIKLVFAVKNFIGSKLINTDNNKIGDEGCGYIVKVKLSFIQREDLSCFSLVYAIT